MNYNNSKIYKLCSNFDDKIYIGSTTQALYKRKYHHKSRAKYLDHLLVYEHFNRIGWENCKIVLIDVFDCASREELLKKERVWYDRLEPVLNKNRPIITEVEKKAYQVQYVRDHKDQYKDYSKKYYLAHRERIIKRVRKRYLRKHIRVYRR